MGRRIAIGGISHETNSYCQGTTPASEFHQLRDDELLSTAGQETDAGGAVSACLRRGIEPVPLLVAKAQPGGIVTTEAYRQFKEEILTGLERAGRLDGVLLTLHGAGVTEDLPDLESDFCRAIRRKVGTDTPVVATFDLHGNVTQSMADSLDGVFACHHYPHIDLHLRAVEAVEFLERLWSERLRTAVAVETVPMLMPTTTTFHGAGKEMLEAMLAAESLSGVLDVSWFHGFPYTDSPNVGSHVVVTTDGDFERASALARRLALQLWNQRAAFRAQSLSPEEAIRKALSYDQGPVVINETSDNPGGGAPGDGTHLLRTLLEADVSNACFGFIVDPEVVRFALQAGVGATIDVQLGGKTDDLHGEPLALRAYVKSLSDGRLTLQAMFRGAPFQIGPMARLVANGLDIVVASHRDQTFDPEPFLAVGIDIRRYQIVALKSSQHFRAGFEPIASAIVTADPPGLTTHRIEIFPRRNARRPLWPLEPGATYP